MKKFSHLSRSFITIKALVTLFFISLLFTFNHSVAQVIDETFEEPIWKTGGHTTNCSSGSVVINATSASSTITYFITTGNSSTTTSVNTSPNSGTWLYSRASAFTTNCTRMGRTRSISSAFGLGSGGYLITPVISNGVASVTFWMQSASDFAVGINTNTTASQPTYNSSSSGYATDYTYMSQTYPASGTAGYSSMQSFSFSGTYSGPVRIGFFNKEGSGIAVEDIVINSFPAGTPPSLTLNSAIKNGKYAGTATATIASVAPTPFSTVFRSGIVWGTTATPDTTLATKTVNGPGGNGVYSGPINAAITGLTAGTQYYVRAFAATSAGLIYSNTLNFTTDPATTPILSTNAVTAITPLSAISGGVISDDGGAAITAKGVCWNTNVNPTTANSKTLDGTGATSFSSLMAVLAANTTYHVRAYATNSSGTSYGNDIVFTTLVAAPTLVALPTPLVFGDVVINNTSSQQSFSVSGIALNTTAVTVTAPTHYQVSLTSGGPFTNSVIIPSTGGTVNNITVYVVFKPTLYGALPGNVTISGGGAATTNVAVTGTGIQSPNDLTNKGTDFWVGYASHENMYNNATSIETNGGDQTMVLYFTATQNAIVTVTIPGLGYAPSPVTITANTVTPLVIPNKIGSQFAQLYQEGKFNKAIHITSDIPIVAYAHIYADFVSGATLLLPVTTWGTEYNAVSYTQQSSANSTSFNYFYVVAKEDNTQIQITPSANTVGGLTANVTSSTITLNKGEVYNVLGAQGTDFTGSKIKSLSCDKKIAVFSGSGRTEIAPCSSTSSDNLFQQIFPRATWGTKYLTSRTIGTVPNNIYRICVSDPNTVVKLNGITLNKLTATTVGTTSITTVSQLNNNFYYEFEDSLPTAITSDKPIMIAQYCKSTAGCNAPTGTYNQYNGDPEMIFISPVTQAIDQATLYSPSNQEISFQYINVIIPTSGVASFTLDGINKASKFIAHPQDANYSYASFQNIDGVTTGTHTIKSNIGFNAIAYGFGDNNIRTNSPPRESYGYNAGTNIRDLTKSLEIDNPFGSSTGGAITCKGMPFKFRMALPYAPADIASLVWNFSGNTNITPNANVTQNAPLTSTGTTVVDGTTLYTYVLNGPYTFTSPGVYTIKVTATITTSEGCSGTKEYSFDVTVVDAITADFTTTPTIICPNTTVQLNDASNAQGTTINQWTWTLPNTSSPITQNTSYSFPNSGSFNVKIRVVNTIGCFAETTKAVVVAPTPVANFTFTSPICEGQNPVLTDASTPTGSVNNWTWSFTDNTTQTVQNPIKTFATAGSYAVKLRVGLPPANCLDSTTKTVVVVAPLLAPIVSVDDSTSNSITFSWAAVTGATSYQVSIDGGVTFTAPSGPGLKHLVTGLSSNQSVTLIVKAIASVTDCGSQASKTGKTILPDLGIFIPNTFTPNGDGKNDILYVRANLIQTMSFLIFNQWGEKIFESKTLTEGWNGYYKGQPAPAGVYIFTISATMTDGRKLTQKGSINLIR